MSSKEPLAVKQLFNAIAPKYDYLNDLFSFGLHRLWKRRLLNDLKPSKGESWLDLCCGTGDLAISLASRVFPSGAVVGLDGAIEPLNLARARAKQRGYQDISWIQGDALKTEIEGEQFDGIVIGYGLRNLSDPEVGLREIFRLLKKGGRAGILDFNKLKERSIPYRFQTLYLRKYVVPVAKRLGLSEHYAYLEESLKDFPNGSLQEHLAYKVGFSLAVHRPIAASQMGILLLQA